MLWLPVSARLRDLPQRCYSTEIRDGKSPLEVHVVGCEPTSIGGDVVLQPPVGSRAPLDILLGGTDYLEVGLQAARDAAPAIRKCVEDADTIMVVVSGELLDPLAASAMPEVVARCVGRPHLTAALVVLPDFGLPMVYQQPPWFGDWRVTLREVEANADVLVVVDPDLLAASIDPDAASPRTILPSLKWVRGLRRASSRAVDILADCTEIRRPLGWGWADFQVNLRSCSTGLLLRGSGDSFSEAMDAAFQSAADRQPRWSWVIARVNGPSIADCDRMWLGWLQTARERVRPRLHPDDGVVLLMLGDPASEGDMGLEVDLLAFGTWDRESRSSGAADASA